MQTQHKEVLQNASALIVEDNTQFRKKFKKTLASYFDRIHEAANGDEAIDIYTDYGPAVIFTDIKMPKMSGLTFTTFIRKVDKNIPIIVLSAYSEKQTLKELISLNLIDFLEKPVDYDTLKEVLGKCAQSLTDNGLIEYAIAQNVKYSFSHKLLHRGKEEIALTYKEILFLELMITNRQRIVTKQMVEDTIYEGGYMSASAISNLISKLRKKAGKDIFKTIPNIGYALVK